MYEVDWGEVFQKQAEADIGETKYYLMSQHLSLTDRCASDFSSTPVELCWCKTRAWVSESGSSGVTVQEIMGELNGQLGWWSD